MSLSIEVDLTTAVLIDGQWYENIEGTFDLDSYEYNAVNEHQRTQGDFTLLHGGGNSGITSIGYTFCDIATQQWISGPLTAIQAVRHKASER